MNLFSRLCDHIFRKLQISLLFFAHIITQYTHSKHARTHAHTHPHTHTHTDIQNTHSCTHTLTFTPKYWRASLHPIRLSALWDIGSRQTGTNSIKNNYFKTNISYSETPLVDTFWCCLKCLIWKGIVWSRFTPWICFIIR